MYNFIDTTETLEGTSLPSEALKINGEYIENLIDGYRTLTVEGREALSPEISTNETGIRDGSIKKGKRYPARTIRITYQLKAASNEDFREAFNKLARILDVEDAQLIFNDEQDKFFTGTPAHIGEVPPGRNIVVGEFEILCLDPFKYSVLEYEVVPEQGETSVILDYNGTYKSYPTLEAEFYNENEADGETVTKLTGSGDCGYVAFFNEDEKIIQIGDPDEADLDTSLAKSQTLVNQSFKSESNWGTAAQSQWKANSGITSSNAVVQAGSLQIAAASFPPISYDYSKRILLEAVSKAEAPYIHYEISAKVSHRNATTAKINFTIATRLDNSESYFGKGYSLEGAVYIAGRWYNVTLKTQNEYWEGTTQHSKIFSVNFTDLTAEARDITGIKFKAYRTDSTGGKSGTLAETACASVTLRAFYTIQPEEYYLTAKSYGTGSDWHGPSITRTIPTDAAGETGAANFTMTYAQKMCIGTESNATNQLGAFQVLLVSGSGSNRKIVAGVNVYKGASGKKASLRFYVNDSVKETLQIDLSLANKNFNQDVTSTITKTGQTVEFNIGGVRKTYKDANIAETAVTEITFTFTQFGTKPALAYNGLYWAKFVKNNCTTWRDIPNKFSANDVVVADCKEGEIFLNGVNSPAYGALGNDWEDFCLTPGINQIGFSYSEWVPTEYAPKFKVKYREVFL